MTRTIYVDSKYYIHILQPFIYNSHNQRILTHRKVYCVYYSYFGSNLIRQNYKKKDTI